MRADRLEWERLFLLIGIEQKWQGRFENQAAARIKPELAVSDLIFEECAQVRAFRLQIVRAPSANMIIAGNLPYGHINTVAGPDCVVNVALPVNRRRNNE